MPLNAMGRLGGHRKSQFLEQPRRGAEVGYEMRQVVDIQLPRGRTLQFKNPYFSPPRPSERLMTSFMISFVPP